MKMTKLTLDQIIEAQDGKTFTANVAEIISNFEENDQAKREEPELAFTVSYPDASEVAPCVGGVQEVLEREELDRQSLDPESDAIFTEADAETIWVDWADISVAIAEKSSKYDA